MKNPLIENLRVAVVPTETGNGIDQSSTVEQILACEETVLYPITDYFKAQNDEEIDLLHWSFLIDITNNTDLTGSNIDGIHQNDKEAKIDRIKSILSTWGMTTASELELECSPCLRSTGSNKNNISELVEEFIEDYARVVTYHNETEIAENDVPYEDLPDDIIDEIHNIIEQYDVEMQKTMDRCKSENN